MSAPAELDIPSLLARLRRDAQRPALTFYRGKTREGRLTYGELVEKVERLAGQLHREHGVTADDPVAILAPNRLEVPVLVLALLRLGAMVVPLNPGSAVDDWTYVLRHSGARGLFATKELAARVDPAARPSFTVHVEDLFHLGGTAAAPAAPSAASRTAASGPVTVCR